jgi:hypothetical protein
MKFIKRWIQSLNLKFSRDWHHVPAPEWAAKRGTGRDYW